MHVLLKLMAYAVLAGALAILARRFREAYTIATVEVSASQSSSVLLFFACYLISGGWLAVLASWDITQFAAWPFQRFLFGGGVAQIVDPCLGKAAQIRKRPQPLDAIRELREGLSERPHDWRIAARIAEIYTHDLNNLLAAALEYEALLARHLPKTAHP